VARPPTGRRNADEPESHDETNDVELPSTGSAEDDEFDDEAGGDTGRTAATDAFWASAQIDPLEIALPDGVGYTLRAYRLNSQITPSDTSARDDEIEFPSRRSVYPGEMDDAGDTFEEGGTPEFDMDEEGDFDPESDDDDVDERPDEEVPLFLSHAGHLLLFRAPGSLVEFVRSGADHDLSQLGDWSAFADRLRPAHLVPLPEDAYELDLVVSNLRGGHDTWDPHLIVQSGQLARDLGHALRIEPIVVALSAGSPLDDLDEALRGVAAGGIGTFFARRKAKKIGTETASLGWRTVIGKISAVVDWRD
jgi:hypothetical protein